MKTWGKPLSHVTMVSRHCPLHTHTDDAHKLTNFFWFVAKLFIATQGGVDMLLLLLLLLLLVWIYYKYVFGFHKSSANVIEGLPTTRASSVSAKFSLPECTCAESVLDVHHAARNSLMMLHNMSVTQAERCTILVRVLGNTSSSQGHKVKLGGLIISEVAGGGGGIDNEGAVEYISDIAMRSADGTFQRANHA